MRCQHSNPLSITMNTDLIKYYKDRAKEYDKLYLKPERQSDLHKAASIFQEIFLHQNVLEIACGTGYWTDIIAQAATAIHATDINESVLEIARHRCLAHPNVRFGIADLFNFPAGNPYEALFGGFIWSHIPLQDLAVFLAIANRLVVPGGRVVFMDNLFVPGSNLPITETDADGNTYQTRYLDDGTSHRVLKNFPTEAFIGDLLHGIATDIQWVALEYYFVLSYQTRPSMPLA